MKDTRLALADQIWQQASAPHTKGETPADTALLDAGEKAVKDLQTAMDYLRRIIAGKRP